MKRMSPDTTFHLTIFLLSTCVILASIVLVPGPDLVSLFGVGIPKVCLWKRMTGMDCPGCGLTRSFTYMGHGQIQEAFRYHKLGPFFWTFVVGLIPWHGVKLARSLLRTATA